MLSDIQRPSLCRAPNRLMGERRREADAASPQKEKVAPSHPRGPDPAMESPQPARSWIHGAPMSPRQPCRPDTDDMLQHLHLGNSIILGPA